MIKKQKNKEDLSEELEELFDEFILEEDSISAAS